MADKKITELTNITGANLVDADEFVVVDISADETKAITLGELKEAFDSGSGFVRITGDTMTGDLALSGADVTFGDNDKAIFGAGSDLQIYSDGTTGQITGDVNITGTVTATGTSVFASLDISGDIDVDGTTNLDVVDIDGAVDMASTLTMSAGGTIRAGGVNDLVLDAGESGTPDIYLQSAGSTKVKIEGSNGNVGIGTSSPIRPLSVKASQEQLTLSEGDARGATFDYRSSTGNLNIATNGVNARTSPQLTLDLNGRLGIGTSSPNRLLSLYATQPVFQITNVASGNTQGTIQYQVSGSTQFNIDNQGSGSGGVIAFMQAGAERMRIDSSGNLLVGKTATGGNTAGMQIINGSFFSHVRDGGVVQVLNRKSSDGDILSFEKDNTTVGGIQTGSGGYMHIKGGNNTFGSGIAFNNQTWNPTNASGTITDNHVKLGDTGSRFTDLYLSGTAYVDTAVEIHAGNSLKLQNVAGNGFATIQNAGAGTNTDLSFNTAGSEAMRIDSSGNVGIGTSSPSANLEITQSGNNVGLLVSGGGYNYTAKFESSDAEANIIIEDSNSTNNGNMIGVATNDMYFITNTSERMRIDSSGAVIINNSGGDAQLYLGGTSGSDRMYLARAGDNGFLWNVDSGYLVFATNNSEAMRIDSSGSVGIGTSSPSERLHVSTPSASGTEAAARFSSSNDASGCKIERSGSSWRLASQGSLYLGADYDANGTSPDSLIIFETDATERMRIDASGNILFNTTAVPSASSGGAAFDPNTNGRAVLKLATTNTGNQGLAEFFNPNGQVGGIVTNGSATAYNTSSDYRLKTDAQPMTGASARVQALNPVNFEWIASGERVDGFLAHEAQEVVPEAVTGTKDAMRDEEYEVTPAVLDDDGNEVTPAVMGTRSVPEYQGIDQSKLVPLLTAALQEALTKIDALETRITALEG